MFSIAVWWEYSEINGHLAVTMDAILDLVGFFVVNYVFIHFNGLLDP